MLDASAVDICAKGQKALGCEPRAERFLAITRRPLVVTPRLVTTRSFKEPRLIFVNGPCVVHQAIREAFFVDILVIALCDTDTRTRSRRMRRNCRRGLAATAAVDDVAAPDSWDATGVGASITAAATCRLDWTADTGAAGGEWGAEPFPTTGGAPAASGDSGLGKGAKTYRYALWSWSSWVIHFRLL